MELYYTFKNRLSLLLAPMALFALVSCGSYQYSGYEADGIYGESRPGIWEQPNQNQETTEVRPNSNNSYYKDLFAQQSEMVGEVLESEVFTDVDSYTSNDGYENYSEVGGDVAYVGGNAPWGEDPDTYTVNIYNNGFYGNRFYGGFYSPWNYGYAYGRGFGFPYGGWYDPYWGGGYGGYAYGGSGWNIGFGFGHGRYHYPFYNSYFNMRYSYYQHMGYPYYQNSYNNIAYNRGRRNSTNTSYRTGGNERNSYSRSIRDIRNSRSSDYNTSRVRNSVGSTDSRVYTRTSRRSEPSRAYDQTRENSRTYNRASRSNSNNSTYRSSSSRSSSSSSRPTTTRSSSSSSRSSGTTTRSSGGRSSRGSRGGGQ